MYYYLSLYILRVIIIILFSILHEIGYRILLYILKLVPLMREGGDKTKLAKAAYYIYIYIYIFRFCVVLYIYIIIIFIIMYITVLRRGLLLPLKLLHGSQHSRLTCQNDRLRLLFFSSLFFCLTAVLSRGSIRQYRVQRTRVMLFMLFDIVDNPLLEL